MPVSPLKWGAYPKPDVAEIYTSCSVAKRKPEDDDEDLESCMLSAPEFKPKRVCLSTAHNVKIVEQMVNPDEAMDDMTQQTDDLPPPHQGAAQPLPSYQESHRHQMLAHEPHQQLAMDHMDLQSGMVMNINSDDGEQYTSACQLMDGEGTVDLNQFESKIIRQHEQHCFGEEMSPNSGTTRCYCRPTWDNLGANQSFFSDIY